MTADEAAPHVRHFMVKLFDRQDGEAAPWALIAEALFKTAFDALDRLPADNADAARLLRRVHAGAYDRLVKNDADPSETGGPGRPDATQLPDRSPQGPSA